MTVSDSVIRLLAAFLFGGIVGLERQIHGRPAGLRTHILVCLGSAIAVIAGIQGERILPAVSIDTGRIIAGVITGVGFLGAGTIVRYREGVGGLTTAACIWFVAMIGILCGFAFYTLAGIASCAALIVLLVLDSLEEKLPLASDWKLTAKCIDRPIELFREECEEILRNRGIRVKSSTFRIAGSTVEISFMLRTKRRETDFWAANEVNQLKGVTGVRWTHRREE